MSEQSADDVAMTNDECLQLLAEALPYVEADARYWDEGSLEGANRRRMAAATDLADRIRRHIDGQEAQ